ncbi:MAG: hypothetical protein H7Z41_18330 [Cytophagales bacterium]|nr:hypothetical protein [Armatimonadota bacterium]
MAATNSPPDKPASEAGGSLSGLKFNSTGRDDTTQEVLKIQRDPGAGRKAAAVVALIVFGLAALGAISFQRSGLKLAEVFSGESHSSFGSQAGQQREVPK